MSSCRSSNTPIDPNVKPKKVKIEVLMDTTRYQKLIDKLIYLSHAQLDIAFAVSVVSQYMHLPFEVHLATIYRILRYLKNTPRKGLFFKKNERRRVEVYIDADWASSITDRRSTSRYCMFIWGNLVTWSKKQSVVARNSVDVEFRVMAHEVLKCCGLTMS